ncbi:3'-5'-exoribonuclease [Ophidiomyces ophidiicola]|nr:3'-5'-exoribonuclease [Ophidiomyces ophidiicola]
MEAAGSHGKGKAAASKSGGRAKSSSKVNNSKMTTTTTTTGRNPGDAAAAAAACRQRKASVKLETATGREEYTANKEKILQRQACDGHENDGDYEDDDDDDDVPLAIKRRMALSTKRPAAADLAAESKRRKLGLGDDECSLSRVGGITSDLEIIAVAPVTAAAAGSGSSSNGWGAAAFTTMGGRDETLFRELPLRPWPGHHQQNKNKNTQGWRLAQEHAVTSSDPPVPRAPLLARASDPAEKNNKNKNTIASSPGDTISLASSTSSSSSLSLMDRRYDDDSNNAGLAAWRPARVPQIVITDMEPHAPRNWLNPRSAAAIGKAEQAVNLALFGPGSQAFRRAPAGVPERGRGVGEGERAGEAVRRYLAVPWSAVEENPRRAREYIVIE